MRLRSKLSAGGRIWHHSAVLVAVVVVALAGCGSDGAQPDTTVTTTGNSAPVSTRGVVNKEQRPAGCQTDDTDQAQPEAAPAGITWKALGGGSVPTSKTAGPLKYDERAWSCFAHTPLGAVIAAHTISSQMSSPW